MGRCIMLWRSFLSELYEGPYLLIFLQAYLHLVRIMQGMPSKFSGKSWQWCFSWLYPRFVNFLIKCWLQFYWQLLWNKSEPPRFGPIFEYYFCLLLLVLIVFCLIDISPSSSSCLDFFYVFQPLRYLWLFLQKGAF